MEKLLKLKNDSVDSFQEFPKNHFKNRIKINSLSLSRNSKSPNKSHLISLFPKKSRNPFKLIDTTCGNDSTNNTLNSQMNYSSNRDNEKKLNFQRKKQNKIHLKKENNKKIELKQDIIKNVIERNKIVFHKTTFNEMSNLIKNRYKTKQNWYYQKEFEHIQNANSDLSNDITENDNNIYYNYNNFNKNENNKIGIRKQLTFSLNQNTNFLKSTHFSKNFPIKRLMSKKEQLPSINYEERKRIIKNAKKKTNKILHAIETLDKEYEEWNINKGTYSSNNLCRVVHLIDIVKYGKTFEDLEIGTSKTELIKFIKDYNRPRLLKTDFKIQTLEKFKSMKGFGFGSYRSGEEYKEMVGVNFMKHKNLD